MESSCVWPIEMIMKWLKSGKLVLDPPYQRGLVWSQALKLDLIDSIRRGYPIPCFFFLERGDTMECFDGKNRINAIHEFVNDKWPHRLSDGGKAEFFSDMPQREQDDFTEHNIVVRKMIGQNWTEATVRDFFKRIQNGASLQYDEEINALDTPLVNVAKEIARRLASTIASLPAINKARHKYLGTIINIIAFHDSVHGPLGGLNVLPDKQKSLISYSKRHTEEQTDAMSVEALTAFVRDVMELCLSLHSSPRNRNPWALAGIKTCKQISPLGFKTASMFIFREGASENTRAIFHDAFGFISAQRDLGEDGADEDARAYLSGRDDRDQYGIAVFNKKFEAFSRIVDKVAAAKTRKRALNG